MITHIRSRVAAAVVAAGFALTGCGTVLDRVEGLASEQGLDVDFEVGGSSGESCLPPSLQRPDGELIASQGIAAGGVSESEICVASSMYEQRTAIELMDTLEAEGYTIMTEDQFPQAAEVFLSLFALQSGLPPDQLNELVTDNLQKAVGPFTEGNANLRAYARDGTVLLLAASDVTEPEIQVTLGLMCEGACR